MRQSPSRALRRHERCAVALTASVVGVFFATTLVLHSTLESVDDEDVVVGKDRYRQAATFLDAPQRALRQVVGSVQRKVVDNQASLLRGVRDTSPTARQLFERNHTPPFDPERIHSVIDPLRVPTLPSPPTDDMTYSIFDCPETPPTGYPKEWNALSVLDHWPIDDTDMPSDYLYQGLCVFDWNVTSDRLKVDTYRRAEQPFVLRNHEQVLQTAERWSTPGYLQDLLGDTPQRNEYSHSNHFMFWRLTPQRQQKQQKQQQASSTTWKPPTEMVELSFQDWYQKAQQLQQKPGRQQQQEEDQTQQDHWYFRLNGAQTQNLNTFLYEELPFFKVKQQQQQQQQESSLFMVDPLGERGINCRFGMKGVFAEAHFDPTRNWIVLLSGQRRYLLAHPRECRNLQVRTVLALRSSNNSCVV